MPGIYADYVQDGDVLPILEESENPFHLPANSQGYIENDIAFQYHPSRRAPGNCIQQTPVDQTQQDVLPQRILISDTSRTDRRNIPSDQRLEVEQLCYAAGIPEMPSTSINGIAFIIPIEALQKSEVQKPWDKIQYNIRRCYPAFPSTTVPFGDAPIARHTYKCTGGKACPYTPIESFTHTEITPDLEARITELRARVKTVNIRTTAIGHIKQIHQRFKKKIACKEQRDTCQLRLSTTDYGEISGVQQYVICCSMGRISASQADHFFYPIPVKYHDFLPLISELVINENYDPDGNTGNICHLFASNRRMRPNCDEVHIGETPKLIQVQCEVMYRFLIPRNHEATPYILVTSHGEHRHPPPPATKTPRSVVDSIIQIVRQINQPSTSLNAFLTSKELKAFLAEHQGRSVMDIHRSLANTDYLRHIIRKQQILLFPQGGQGIALALLKTNERNSKTCYIQHAVQSYTNYMIICFYHEQAKQWRLDEMTSFMVDANYKHVKGPFHREIIWAWYSHNSEKALPLARCFTNSETTEMYHYMFRQVFYILENKYAITVKWKYIDGTGLLGITLDQGTSVIRGFGLYLQEKFEPEQPIEYHLASTTRLCAVHFERGVTDLLGEHCPKGIGTTYNVLMSLLRCTDAQDYDAICDEITKRFPQYKEWVKHKKSPIIAAGFCQEKSRIPRDDWNLIPKDTNTVEIMHAASYLWTGRYLPIVQLINGVKEQDWNLVSRDEATRVLQIPTTYRNTGVSGRFDSLLQKQKRKRAERGARLLDEEPPRSRSRRRTVQDSIESSQQEYGSSVDSLASSPSEMDIFNIQDDSDDPAFRRASSISSSGVPTQSRSQSPRGRTPARPSQTLRRQVIQNQTNVQQSQLAFEEQQLQLEQRRREMERQDREAAVELEIKRRAAEAEEQRRTFELEQRMEIERERMRMELQYRPR
ncbi:hypothetical protein F5B21DRAFT_468085 [Xylaria acuta]|nr:hypothetical protein F5B21DRAFT_468085 [Xylaria acuta]